MTRRYNASVGGTLRLANRMTLWILVVLTVVMVLQGAQRLQRVSLNLSDDSRRDHAATSVILRDATEEMWAARGRAEALGLLAGLDLRRADRSVRWVRSAPEELGESPQAPADWLARVPPGDPAHWDGFGPDRQPFLYTYVRIQHPDAQGGMIELGEPLSRQQRYVRSTATRAALWLVVVLAAVAVVVHAMGRVWIGQPVSALVAHARRVGAGDFAQRLPPGRPDELGDLAGELNAMTDRLVEALEAARREAGRRAAAEDQLRHADRLAIAGRLSASIAHELGTPLNVVRLHAQLVEAGEVDEPVESARAIVQQCDRMAGLIGEMLDFVRPRGRGVEPIDLPVLVERSLALVAPLARKSQVQLHFSRGDGPLAVLGTSSSLQQVLLNLVVNGIHAMPEGGPLEVRLVADPRAGRAGVRIDVTDRGVGIPAELHERIFEPFFSTKAAGVGTGLGLCVVRDIVDEHGGAIGLVSAAGEGACFSIWLPCAGTGLA